MGKTLLPMRKLFFIVPSNHFTRFHCWSHQGRTPETETTGFYDMT